MNEVGIRCLGCDNVFAVEDGDEPSRKRRGTRKVSGYIGRLNRCTCHDNPHSTVFSTVKMEDGRLGYFAKNRFVNEQ